MPGSAGGVVLVVLFLSIVLLAGILYQWAGLARDARQFSPPGRLIEVGGRRLHVVCAGDGTPPVVLESAIAASSLSWARVQPLVARFTRVCAYDRSGLAWSDASTSLTFDQIVSDLDAVIATVDCRRPCVFVGHSFGVFVCLAYAARHLQDVAGLVLVDPPSEWMEMTTERRRMLRGGVLLSRIGGLLARVGVVRACLGLLTGGAPEAPRQFVRIFGPRTAGTVERLVGEVRKLPPELHPVVQALWCRPRSFRAMGEHLRVLEDAARSARAIGSLKEVPLVVISSGDQPADVIAAHHDLARLSSRGRVVVASRSGHWVPFDEPELIADAVREIVQT
jgi:pimeloyl-ACP methyl ester carboxylesterase